MQPDLLDYRGELFRERHCARGLECSGRARYEAISECSSVSGESSDLERVGLYGIVVDEEKVEYSEW